MKDLYLDSSAHMPLHPAALKALIEFNNSKAGYGNPSSPSVPGREAAAALEDARGQIAELIGAQNSNQIIFTSSATQACQWATKILFARAKTITISPVEHNAVKDACDSNWDEVYSEYDRLKINSDGLVIDDRELDGVACIYVQSEIGTIQPIDKLDCNYIFSDMTQSLGKMPVNVTELDIDVAAFGAHKFGGPMGVGFMYLKNNHDWVEFGTGSRYFMDYPGTPNVAGAVATAAALREAVKTLPERMNRMVEFRTILEKGLKELDFEIIGEGQPRVFNTTFVKVPCGKYEGGRKANCGLSLMMELGDVSVYGSHVGLGSACGSIYTGGSPLMKALGRPSDGQDYIRISQWGDYGATEANYVLTRIQNASKTYV
jgi:cysteine desulfurase